MATTLIIPGTVIEEGSCRASHGRVDVRGGEKPGTVVLSFNGIVVSLIGGAAVAEGRSTWEEVVAMTRMIAHVGGVIVNGGEDGGVMLASARIAPASTLGIVTVQVETHAFGPRIVVESRQTRHAILTKLPVVVVFEGGAGTIAAWASVLKEIKESLNENRPIPTLYLHDYWKSTIDELWKVRALPKRIMDHVQFFAKGTEVAQEVAA